MKVNVIGRIWLQDLWGAHRKLTEDSEGVFPGLEDVKCVLLITSELGFGLHNSTMSTIRRCESIRTAAPALGGQELEG